MAAGIGALKSALGRVKIKLSIRDNKTSVIFYDPFTGEYELPPEEKLNKFGVLLLPCGISEEQWELFCDQENQEDNLTSSCPLSTNSSNQK